MAESLPNVLLLAGRFQVRGTSMQTLNLARHLPSSGFRVRVVCPDAQLMCPQLRGTSLVTEMPHLDVPGLGWFAKRLLLKELADDPPQLIHIQQRSELAFGSWLASRLQCPFVLTIHDYLSPQESIYFNSEWGRHIIAVSESVRTEFLERTQLSDSLVSVIHCGVDLDENVEGLPPEDVLRPSHTPVVGTIGPLEAAKGLRFFLDAIPRVLEGGRDVQFLIAGAGPEEGSLRRLTEQLDIIPWVTFVPNVLDVRRTLDAMDIYCLPSLRQGLGTIMLEAMARGRPVIASGVGGVYGVVQDRETGLLVPPSDSKQLADAIIEYLDHPDFARRIGHAARCRVRSEYPVSRMIEQTVQVYHNTLCPSHALPCPSIQSDI